jgi:hypothetical protein
MRKKFFEEDRVYTKTTTSAPTNSLGDSGLERIPQAKPSTLLQRAQGDGKPVKDKEGLDQSYLQGDVAVRGNAMYIAGSHYAIDWLDDLTRVPFWGDVKKSYRYKQADRVLRENSQIDTLIGHSLGGSVAHQLQRNHPGLRTVTYGSPAVSWNKGGERWRNQYDPVSMFDRGAVQLVHPNPTSFKALTHDYHNNENVSATSGDYGKENPDGSVSITM